ncbi:hypothetical protein BKA65DRAFT_546749 [Rhexocercosporidium sp. MPI-PUGE-AT-0058]|nr:hypothetical protein BKA65DRAFT_546749 [Rhexocercosporidium sp. MPI-PUGE-AT-0058]
MQLAFEEQEELLATSPSSPGRRSFESSHPPIDQDCDRGWSEELRSSSRLCSQDKEKEGPDDQEQEEMAADEIRQDNEGINSGIYRSESSGHGHDTNDDDDEDDEEDEHPQPAKKRRLSRVSPDMPPTPPLEHSPKPYRGQPHSLKPSSTTQLEIGDAQSQTDLAHPPTSVNNDHHYTTPSSRSPSDTEELASAAKYQECPSKVF